MPKILDDLDCKLKDLDDRAYRLGGLDGEECSLRRGLILACASMRSEPFQAMVLYDIALKLKAANGRVELTDSEQEALKGALKANPVGYPAPLLAQLWKRIA